MMLPYLRLVRASALFSPAADVVAGMALSGVPWSAAAVRACLASVLVYAAGMALNDHADRRVDAVHRPGRPIPSGQIPAGVAAALGAALLLGGVAISPVPLWHALLGGLVLAYDYALKRSATLGALTMGALRGLNLLTGAALAAAATAGWIGWDSSAWPTLLDAAGRPLLYAALAYAVAIIAITFLGVCEDHRSVRPRTIQSLISIAPLAWFLGVWGTTEGAVAPAIAGVAVVTFALRHRNVVEWSPRAIRGAMLWLLLGTSLYDALLCAGRARWLEAGAILLTIPVARWLARSMSPT